MDTIRGLFQDDYPNDSKYAKVMARYLSTPLSGERSAVNEWNLFRDWAKKRRPSDRQFETLLKAFDSGVAHMVLKHPPRNLKEIDRIFNSPGGGGKVAASVMASDVLKIAREMVSSPKPVLKSIYKGLDNLDKLSENIEKSVKMFFRHFKAAVSPEVRKQTELLNKAIDGIREANKMLESTEQLAKEYPGDKDVEKALKDIRAMLKRFESLEKSTRKVVTTISKKEVPPD
jgi:hypothetical protein